MTTAAVTPRRRIRISSGFGRAPRFVLASSVFAARLLVVRLAPKASR